MQAFTTWEGIVVPLDRANIDTDAIIPKQFMKSIRRTGFGANLFDEWRYLDPWLPGQDNSKRRRNPDFVLNQPRYEGASVLLTRENFGCGSSREHAPWALRDFGIRALLAPSFADIFYGNCFKNGLLPVVLDAVTIERLFQAVQSRPGYRLRIDLAAQTVETPEGERLSFEVDPFRKHCLYQGLDDIALTLERAERIRAYEQRRRALEPWLFP
jgi:3-isopropylmalate/(R)-2-methylmalate dehydratase small subunit